MGDPCELLHASLHEEKHSSDPTGLMGRLNRKIAASNRSAPMEFNFATGVTVHHRFD